jgi:SAM-dependent methyltransferase
LRVLYPLASLIFGIIPGGRDFAEGTVCFLRAPEPGARLLEVGFGDGSTLVRMRDLGWNVVGIEADPVAVENSRGLGLDTRLGGLNAQAFQDASFDAIYASHVLEHVHNPVGLLQECYRILKPGGVVVMITPNIESSGHRRFRATWMPLHPPRHLMLFSPGTVRTLAERAGFRGPRVRTTARYAKTFSMVSEICRQRGRLDGQLLPIPAWITRRATLQHLADNMLIPVKPHAGEEVVLVAKK